VLQKALTHQGSFQDWGIYAKFNIGILGLVPNKFKGQQVKKKVEISWYFISQRIHNEDVYARKKETLVWSTTASKDVIDVAHFQRNEET